MNATQPIFRTIDVERDLETAVAFRRDAYRCSFGHDDAVEEAGRYRSWLAERIERHPGGHVHVWQDGLIVGQIEMAVGDVGAGKGYVNLFYLVPEVRGTGLGERLHEYFVKYMRAQGARVARLRVGASNPRAMAYYTSHGWVDLGIQPSNDRIHVMEFEFGLVSTPVQ